MTTYHYCATRIVQAGPGKTGQEWANGLLHGVTEKPSNANFLPGVTKLIADTHGWALTEPVLVSLSRLD